MIFDVFKGQMCQSTVDMLMENNIHFIHVPANCTNGLQPLDISVNKCCKDFMRQKFVDWYAGQVYDAIDRNGDELFQADLRLAVMKPLRPKWFVSFFEYICSKPDLVYNGFKAAGISNILDNTASSQSSS